MGVDSGATENMTFNREVFTKYNIVNEKYVKTADGTKLKVHGMGQVSFSDGHRSFILQEVLHIPKLTRNLLSISNLTSKGCSVEFKEKLL